MVLALVFIAIIILVIFFRFIPFGLWLTALFSGVRVSFFTLFGMRFRRVDPKAIVFPLDQRAQGRHRAQRERSRGPLPGGRQRAAGGATR